MSKCQGSHEISSTVGNISTLHGSPLVRFQHFLNNSGAGINNIALKFEEIEVTIKTSMDLKLTALMQGSGRINLCKSHCLFCDTRVNLTNKDNKEAKDVWYPNTQHRLRNKISEYSPQQIEAFRQFTMGTQAAIDTDCGSYAWWQCGWCTPTKKDPPFKTHLPSIPLEDWVPPTLHMMLGIASKPYLALVRFIEVYFRQTNVSIAIKMERNEKEDAEIVKLTAYLKLALSTDPEAVAGLRQVDALLDISSRNEEEEDAYLELMYTYSVLLDPVTGMRNVEYAHLQDENMKKVHSQVLRNHNNRTQYANAKANPVFNNCAQILSKYGVDASVHFGGTIVGRHCDKLMNTVEDIWQEIEAVFLQVSKVNNKGIHDLEQKSSEFCKLMKELSSLLVQIFDRLRSEVASSEDDIQLLERHVIPTLANL